MSEMTNNPDPLVIAITGGIGAGKSVVAQSLRVMGYKVFDCDCEAKRLMDASVEIRAKISDLVDCEVVNEDGIINRQKLASIVFSDAEKLRILNSIVHSAVIDEIIRWRAANCDDDLLFVETAILYQSKIDKIVDMVIEVVAPDELRLKRVMRRNGLSEKEVMSRIESQVIDIATPHPLTTKIVNDDVNAVIPQLLSFISKVQ